MIAFDVPDPRGLSFTRWASLLTEGLAAYNVPSPVEDEWFGWACALFSSPDLAQQGLPDPRGFADWQSWAERVFQALQT